jgi:hypothetical protein
MMELIVGSSLHVDRNVADNSFVDFTTVLPALTSLYVLVPFGMCFTEMQLLING